MIMITDNFIAPDFVEQVGTVQDADGNEYRVAVTHNLLSGSLNSGETLERSLGCLQAALAAARPSTPIRLT